MRKIRIPDSYVLSSSDLRSFYLWTEKPYSKYCGLFFEVGNELVKCIEKIETNSTLLKTKDNIFKLTNDRSIVLDKSKQNSKEIAFKEFILMSSNSNALAYCLSKKLDINLVFDIRQINDFSEWGRIYSIYEKKDCIIIHYQREEANTVKYKYYVAIKQKLNDIIIKKKEVTLNNFDKANSNSFFEKIEKFSRSDYAYDNFRNSNGTRYVFEGLKLNTDFFTLAMAESDEEAIQSATDLFTNFEEVEKQQREHVKKKFKRIKASEDIIDAYKGAHYSFEKLISNKGISAGYPWFFHIWTRDEMISSKYLLMDGQFEEAKTLFNKYLIDKKYAEYLPAIYPNLGNPCADGRGWMIFRFCELLEKSKEKKLEIYSEHEMMSILSFVEAVANNIIANFRNGLVYSGRNESWMDTDFNDNGREGYCIEIQALALRALAVAYLLTGKMEYKNAEDDLRAKVLVHFYVNDNLVDFIYPETTGNGLTNASYLIRPNVFIAYYVYSELLPAEQWEIIFDKALEGLWLDWGGLSSLDKRNSAFVNEHTGENNASYHRGDSWYYLNCMAATCLLKVNREKYLATADKIISACTEECLHNGVIGSLDEVSSAKELSGYGCFSQAWSLAMFIELIEERY